MISHRLALRRHRPLRPSRRRQSASAECAWILWQNIETINQIDDAGNAFAGWAIASWTREKANTSNKECVLALNRLQKQWSQGAKVGDKRNKHPCLPDTVDPRKK